MNNRVLLATLAGGVTMFLLGYLFWGILLADTFRELSPTIEGVERNPPDLFHLALANLVYALLFAMIFSRWAGISTFRGGMMGGAWISALYSISFNLMFLATTHLSSFGGAALDVVTNIVVGAIVGGVIGWVLGYGNRE